MKERPLVIFTILSQMAVGIFLAVGGVHTWLSFQAGLAFADLLTDRILLAALPLGILGMLASFFHLGSPHNAWRAFTNLRTSWLSREILCASLFAGLGGVFTLLQWFKLGPFALRLPLAWLAALSGLGLVYCMSRVYMLRSLPPWNSRFTLLSFFMTVLLLGGLAAGLALAWEYAIIGHNLLPGRDPLEREMPRQAFVYMMLPLRWIGAMALFALGIQFIAIPWWSLRQGSSSTWQQHRLAFSLRLGLLFCSLLVLSALLLFPYTLLSNWSLILAGTLAFTGLIISEIIGRVLFYASYSRQGV